MSDEKAEQQAANPAEQGEIPAESPPAVQAEAPDQPVDTSGDDAGESRPDKPKGGFQRRIAELTARQRQLREDLAKERAEREALIRKLNPDPSEKEPARDQFDDWDSYERAKIQFETRRAIREETQLMQSRAQQAALEQQAAQVHAEWESRLEAARDMYEDVDEYVDVVGERLNPTLAEAIKTSEMGPQLVRHLGQHPKELERITSLPDVRAIYALARLESQLSAKQKASAAPTPPNPVKTTAAPANSLRDDIDVKSWMEKRRTELRKA